MLLLAFAIVSSLQAVGVVLVSAMLVIPAAAAFLLTDRLGIMLILSAIFGMVSGGAGAFFSFVGRNLPTGPFMVLAAGVSSRRRSSSVRGTAFFPAGGGSAPGPHEFAREHPQGDLPCPGGSGFRNRAGEHARARRAPPRDARRGPASTRQTLRRHQYVTMSSDGDSASLTPEGWHRACEIVRNHRLWELYLTNAAHLAARSCPRGRGKDRTRPWRGNRAHARKAS